MLSRLCSAVRSSRRCLLRSLQVRTEPPTLSKKTLPKSLADSINANVANDVILFQYDNWRFCCFLNLFGLFHLCFWLYISDFVRSTLKDIPVSADLVEGLPWYRRINLGTDSIRHAVSLFCAGVGVVTLACSWLYCLRSVTLLVLMKGGQKAAFVTFSPLFMKRTVVVPADMVSCRYSRYQINGFLPLKVKGVPMNYALDMRGDFRSPRLFDWTLGSRKPWMK